MRGAMSNQFYKTDVFKNKKDKGKQEKEKENENTIIANGNTKRTENI